MANKRADGEGSIFYDPQRQEYRCCIRYGNKADGTQKRICISSGKGGKRSDVTKKVNEWRLAMQKGYADTNAVHLEEGMKLWLETIKKPDLKAGSYDRLESTIANHIIPRLGGYELKLLTDNIIKDELLDEMLKEGLSQSSVKKAYDAMHGYLNYAVYKDYIPKNPMGMMKPPKSTGDRAATKETTDDTEENAVNFLSDEEIRRLYDFAAFRWKTGNIRYPMGQAFILILNTGMRMGEALALRWTDINWTSKSLSITKNLIVAQDRDQKAKTKQKLIVQSTPKSQKSRRVLPLNKDALAALEALKERDGYSEVGYIIRTGDGNPMLPKSFQQTLDLLCVAAGIRKIGLHTLRHTYATKMFEAKVDVKIISELLGHSSTEITYRIYIHVLEKMKTDATQAAFDIMPQRNETATLTNQ